LVATFLVNDSCWLQVCCHSPVDLIGQLPCNCLYNLTTSLSWPPYSLSQR
jgi:hypothetical protein